MVEIPPPRPKRKPVHPYPRKPGSVVKTSRTSTTEKLTRSVSQDVSTQSPTSVLSENHSDESARAGSSTPQDSSSPVSSIHPFNATACYDTEVPTSSELARDEEVSPVLAR